MKPIALALLVLLASCAKKQEPSQTAEQTRTITDGTWRTVTVPAKVERIICSGAGALRLITYLNAQDLVVAVDGAEKPKQKNIPNFCPYFLANPQYRSLPLFGESKGADNPELIASLEPQPQVIVKTYSDMGVSPEELQQKTGIPTVSIVYGDLTNNRELFFTTLRLLGDLLNRKERADSVIAFINGQIEELNRRTISIPDSLRLSPYIGGVSYSGVRGIGSTVFHYPPFRFTGTKHVAETVSKKPLPAMGKGDISSEQLIAYNPKLIFIDLSTTRGEGVVNGLKTVTTAPEFADIPAVKNGELYGVLPYNSYSINFELVLANCWFVGKTLYPEQFEDVNPQAKTDSICQFFVGKPMFDTLNFMMNGRVFTKLEKTK